MKNSHPPASAQITIIRPHSGWVEIGLLDIFRYRDLIRLLVHRDFTARYKQTILGPLWFLIQPLLSSFILTLVFGKIAGITTDGIPQVLFFLASTVLWSFFADTFTAVSETFTANASIFGKVYFPRLVVPVAVTVTNILRLGIQLVLVFAVYLYFLQTDDSFRPSWTGVLFLPVVLVLVGLLALACGLVVAALTSKYRDLRYLTAFGLQLWMYSTPIVYPLSKIPEKYLNYALANPVTGFVELYRWSLFGSVGSGLATGMLVSLSATLALLSVGALVFSRVERTFVDTV